MNFERNSSILFYALRLENVFLTFSFTVGITSPGDSDKLNSGSESSSLLSFLTPLFCFGPRVIQPGGRWAVRKVLALPGLTPLRAGGGGGIGGGEVGRGGKAEGLGRERKTGGDSAEIGSVFFSPSFGCKFGRGACFLCSFA